MGIKIFHYINILTKIDSMSILDNCYFTLTKIKDFMHLNSKLDMSGFLKICNQLS
jgi:hypothetical protein